MVRSRRFVWTTLTNLALTAMVSTDTQNVNLLTALQSLTTTDQGLTVVRTLVTITPTTAPVLGDRVLMALGVGRNEDIGHNVANSITANQVNRPWAAYREYFFNGSYTSGGGNTLVIAHKGGRKVSYDDDAWMLAVATPTLGASTVFNLFARVGVLLP